jgi:hypothetical protein
VGGHCTNSKFFKQKFKFLETKSIDPSLITRKAGKQKTNLFRGAILKKLLMVLGLAGMLMSLVACSDQSEAKDEPAAVKDEDSNEEAKKEKEQTGVAPESLSATLKEITPEKNEKSFLYEVTNNSDQDLKIPFSKNGGFHYVVRDEAGNEVSRTSGSGTIENEQVLIPGDSLTTKIGMGGLRKGTYELEVWFESVLENTYNQTIVFTVE